MSSKRFQIHGDNIVECERLLDMISRALSGTITGPTGSIVTPTYIVTSSAGRSFKFTFLPGYGRWDRDFYSATVRQNGGLLDETADVLLTELTAEREQVRIAVEFCGAIPAGNQAWQRNGRAYACALAGVPYLFVAEIGAYELDENRELKAERRANPAVPFSYIACGLNVDTPIAPIYLPNPGANEDTLLTYDKCFGEAELLEILCCVVEGTDFPNAFARAQNRALELVKTLAEERRLADSLSAAEWEALYNHLHRGNSFLSYLPQTNVYRRQWIKKVSQKTKATRNFTTLLSKVQPLARPMTGRDLPICVVPATNRRAFAREVGLVYGPRVSDEFITWVGTPDRDLVVCWVNGFKHGGNDARPDRGVLPLARMLSDVGTPILTILFGPAPSDAINRFFTDPGSLMTGIGQSGQKRQNGLWQAVMALSNALLLDSINVPINRTVGHLRHQWIAESHHEPVNLTPVSTRPRSLKEHDVDTVLHTLFTRFLSEHSFEGMCNPPGGDWSGLSVMRSDRSQELRWLSLPRVSPGDKRPDHLIQLFPLDAVPTLLAIESKEKGRDVEKEIGPRLRSYVRNLLQSAPNAVRAAGPTAWKQATPERVALDFPIVTGAAYLGASDDQARVVALSADVDVVLAVNLSPDTRTAEIGVLGATARGKQVAEWLRAKLPEAHPLVTVRLIGN